MPWTCENRTCHLWRSPANTFYSWLIRRRNWKVPDLYVGDRSSIYWYRFGLNWRAFTAWTLAVFPSFPGFVVACGGATLAPYWLRIFQAAWFVGFLGGGSVYLIVCLISPPPGKPYITEYFGNEGHGGANVIDGRDGSGYATPDVEKTQVAPIKT